MIAPMTASNYDLLKDLWPILLIPHQLKIFHAHILMLCNTLIRINGLQQWNMRWKS